MSCSCKIFWRLSFHCPDEADLPSFSFSNIFLIIYIDVEIGFSVEALRNENCEKSCYTIPLTETTTLPTEVHMSFQYATRVMNAESKVHLCTLAIITQPNTQQALNQVGQFLFATYFLKDSLPATFQKRKCSEFFWVPQWTRFVLNFTKNKQKLSQWLFGTLNM